MAGNRIRPTPIKIIEINVNSLISLARRQNMREFLNLHKPHAVLLVETLLRTNHRLSFSNYNFVRTDKDSINSGRGTGILIKDNVQFEPINTHAWNLKSLEATAVLIKTESNQNLLLVSAYRRHQARSVLDITDLDIIMDQKSKWNSCDIVIGGDLNARHENWLNTARCPSGEALVRWLNINSAFRDVRLIHSAEPTFYRGNHSSHLDVFIISEDLRVIYPSISPNLLSILDYPSDHRAVELFFNLNSNLEKKPPVQIPFYSGTNWKRFNEVIDVGINDIYIPNNINMTSSEIDAAVLGVTELINNSVEEIVPKIIIRNLTPFPIPDDLKHLIAEKNRLRRRWQRRRYDHNEFQLRSEINCLQKIVKDRLKILNTQHWERSLGNIKLDNNTFANIRKFTKKDCSSNVHALKIDVASNMLTSDKVVKAKLLADQFEAVHRQNLLLGDPIFTANVNQYVEDNISIQHPIITHFSQHATANPSFVFDETRHLVSINLLKAAIRSRANKKSKGEDNVSNYIIKKLSGKFIIALAMIFNHAYNIAYFPSSWKTAIIVPLLKKLKPPNEPASYRPISLLSCLGKLYEHSIKRIITDECHRLKVTPDDQFSQFTGRSTSMPLVKFANDITTNLNAKIPTIACTLDVEKAFDTVWIVGLIYKMHHDYGFSTHICKLLLCYLSERWFRVIVDMHLSPRYQTAAGVPQGGVLSALLYVIFIADLPLPPVTAPPINRLQYADDILVYLSCKNLLRGQDFINDYLNTIQDHLAKWKIKLNPKKIEAIVFKGTNKQHSNGVNRSHKLVMINVGGHPIALQNEIKYLGIIFSKRPTFSKHVTHTLTKATKAYHGIKHILKRVNKLDTKIKLLCYKQLIRPIIAYGFPAWAGISAHQMERLRVFERKCLRACINYRRPIGTYRHIRNSALYEQGAVKRIDCFMINCALKTFDKWPTLQSLDGCTDHDPDLLDDPTIPYKPPWYIPHTFNGNQADGSVPLIYHNRYSINKRHLGLVYSTDV